MIYLEEGKHVGCVGVKGNNQGDRKRGEKSSGIGGGGEVKI